jgi:hypothetical protein
MRRCIYFCVLLVSFALSAFSTERGKQWYGTIPSAPGDEQFQRIYVQDGTLFHEDGSEVALWGVNFQSAMSGELGSRYPDMSPRDFDLNAWKLIVSNSFDEIQQMGCEVIRIHLCPGDFADAEGNLVETDWLDVLDYTMAECHRRGIYINLSLHNSWQQRGGVVNPTFFGNGDKEHNWELMSVPKKRAASANYITQFVNRPNPYDNNRPYKNNPAWIICEISNEPTFPKSKPDGAEFPDGIAVYEQWLLDHGKPDNKNSWSEFKYETIKNYINLTDSILLKEKVPAVSSWNLFWSHGPNHQGWESYDAAADSNVDIVSFSTYPGQSDSEKEIDLSDKNYLPYLQDSYDTEDKQGWLQQSRFKGQKAIIVYEWETWHNQSTYMYPAVAKYFRAQGAQVATMWTYTLSGAGEHFGRTMAHYLNMVTTPRKAASFLVAREVFKETPRYIPYGTTEDDADRFGNAALSFPMDLSAYASDDLLIHTGDLKSDFIELPRIPKKIAGYGSSPFVDYQGKGMYFLEAVFEDGQFTNRWTLKVMPHAEFVGKDTTDVNREQTFPFTLRFPGMDFRGWEVRRTEGGRTVRAATAPLSISFDATPGDYEIFYDIF